jgi:hypothetical protein
MLNATRAAQQCILVIIAVLLSSTVENTLLRFHGDALNIYTDNISISTKQKTIKITVVAFYNCCSLYC